MACEPSESIVTLHYLGDESIIATSDSRGNVVLWGGRSSRHAGKRIAGFMNHTTYLSVLEPRKRPANPDEREMPRRAFPSESGSEEYPGLLPYVEDPANLAPQPPDLDSPSSNKGSGDDLLHQHMEWYQVTSPNFVQKFENA